MFIKIVNEKENKYATYLITYSNSYTLIYVIVNFLNLETNLLNQNVQRLKILLSPLENK